MGSSSRSTSWTPLVDLVPEGWGPVGSVAVLAVAGAGGFLGLRRPTVAGWLIIAVAVGQAASALLARSGGVDGIALRLAFSGSAGVVVLPLLVIGALFLLAGHSPGHRAAVAPAH